MLRLINFNILLIYFICLQVVVTLIGDFEINLFFYIHTISIIIFVRIFSILYQIGFKYLFKVLFIYSLLTVFIQYLFNDIYFANKLGYNPSDAVLYDDIAKTTSSMNIWQMMNYLNVNLSIADFGFPFVLWIVYSFSIDGFLVMKVVNILAHIISCFYLYKITSLLFDSSDIKKIIVLLFGLSPLFSYYGASGLKEPVFTLFIIIGTYYLYLGYLVNSKNLLYGFFFVILSGFFRIYTPFLIIIAVSFLLFFKINGKYSFIIKVFFVLFLVILLTLTVNLFSSELLSKLGYNSSEILMYRLGHTPSMFERLFLYIGGILGPFPSFQYDELHTVNLLETLGNFIKIFFSGFFVIGLYKILLNKKYFFYPLLIIILVNTLITSLLGLSLDPRFSYIFNFTFYLIVGLGIESYASSNKLRVYNTIHFVSMFLVIIIYNLR